jgi:hypothetical protein
VTNWRIGFATLLLLWSASGLARHSSGNIDPRRATPGIRLELVALPSTVSLGTTKYRLRAEGVPPGVTFGVWTKDFGQEYKQAFSGVHLDEAGVLISVDGSGQTRRLEDIAIDPGPYPNGAVWIVALASDDYSLSAFAKVIPHPIAGRDGACAVHLELISLHGNRFIAAGEGFTPGEEVDIQLRSSGHETQRKQRISAEGLLPLDIVSHGAVSTDFSARYEVKSPSCKPIVRYEWGEAALVRH